MIWREALLRQNDLAYLRLHDLAYLRLDDLVYVDGRSRHIDPRFLAIDHEAI